MFDSVGKNLDEDAAKRSAQSALIASVLVASVASAIVCAGLWKVKQVVLDDTPVDEISEIVIDDAEPDIAAPPPPPPPPAASAPVEDEEEEEPTPDEMIEKVVKLDEKIDEKIKSAVKPAGEEGGDENGVTNGVKGGVVGGDPDGVIGGKFGGGGGPRVVHYSQVEVKKRVEPTYPAAARGLGLGEQRCKVTVDIDADGVPTRVAIDGCPKVFHPETEQAIYKWRWYPFKSDGVKAAAQFTIMVKYRETQ